MATQTLLLTDKQVEADYGLKTRFLQHDRLNNRTIPFIKINQLVRYKKSDLDAFIDSARIGGEVA